MTKLLFALSTAALLLSACVTSEQPEVDPAATSTSASELTVSCTPGAESCDWGCFYVGGPSTDDCIVRCNAAGTGYVEVENCGYAQNFPYSSSCRETQPHPVCEWN